MFTFQILGLAPLKNFIFPLLDISEYGDIKCSPLSVSLIVSYEQQPSRFTAALQMFAPFFTCLSSHGVYHSRFHIFRLFLELYNIGIEDIYMTFLLPEVDTIANVVFTVGVGDIQFCNSLMLLPPQVEDLIESDDAQVYVAITAVDFREIATQLSIYNTKILVTASSLRVKFSVATNEIFEEIVLTAERGQCMAGGLAFGDEGIEFSFSLNPIDFFRNASFLTEFVWFFRSYDLCTTMKFFTGDWNHIVVYYPDDHMRRPNGVAHVRRPPNGLAARAA